MLKIEDWHKRFKTQARWTEQVRRYLYQQAKLEISERILEVGCGTGVITSDIREHSNNPGQKLFGLDIREESLKVAHSIDGSTAFTCGDALHLPFPNQIMDVTLCHFLLLWLKNPLKGVQEMCRVTRNGGVILALAEPDYGGRIDFPPALADLGQFQTRALLKQGAEPNMGRRLSSIFHQAGLKNVVTGLLGGQWNAPPSNWEWESEWAVMEEDLGSEISQDKFQEFIKSDYEAWHAGERVLFVPTFFAIGQV